MACGLLGPGYVGGGFVDIMECLFFPCHGAVRMMYKVAAFVLVCSEPLSVLPGNSNTLWGWGLVKRMSI